MQNFGIVLSDIKYISEEVHQSMKGTEVIANDLLLNITGGSLGRCAVVPINFKIGNVSQHVCILRTVLVKPEYLHCFILSSFFAKSMKITGSGREGLPKYNLEKMLFPLPPIHEQERIIIEVKQLRNYINKLDTCRGNLIELVSQAKSKVLDLAIHGKLVPQDPSDEPASELLKRINPKAEITCDNPHYRKLPKGWIIAHLSNIAEIKNGYAFKSSNYISSNGIRIIRIANVQDGFIEDKTPQYYPKESCDDIEKFFLKEKDLLMSLTGNVGRVGLLPQSFLPAALNQRVACIRENELLIDKEYLYYLFQSNEFQRKCIKSAKGVAQLNISTEWIKCYQIPIPPLAEQKRIVETISLLFANLRMIEASL